MLALSIKGKYGLSILLELALNKEGDPMQIRELAKVRDVPHTYLEQILITLRKAGFVQSFRGAKGGYKFAKDPESVSVGDVLVVLEGPLELSESYCGCSTLGRFWKGVEEAIEKALRVSLAELIKDKQKTEKMLTYTI